MERPLVYGNRRGDSRRRDCRPSFVDRRPASFAPSRAASEIEVGAVGQECGRGVWCRTDRARPHRGAGARSRRRRPAPPRRFYAGCDCRMRSGPPAGGGRIGCRTAGAGRFSALATATGGGRRVPSETAIIGGRETLICRFPLPSRRGRGMGMDMSPNPIDEVALRHRAWHLLQLQRRERLAGGDCKFVGGLGIVRSALRMIWHDDCFPALVAQGEGQFPKGHYGGSGWIF